MTHPVPSRPRLSARLTETSRTSAARRLTDARGGAATWIIAVLVLAAVAFAVYWFVFRKAGGAGESAALASRVMPAEVDIIGGIDIAGLTQSPVLRDLAKAQGVDLDQIEAKLKEGGVALADLRSVALGGRVDGGTPKDILIAIETRTDTKALAALVTALVASAPADAASFLQGLRVEPLEGGIVVTGSSALVDLALAVSKGQGKALGQKAGLDEIQSALDTGAAFWVAGPVPAGATAQIPGMFKNLIGGTPTHAGFSFEPGETSVVRGAILIPGADAANVASALGMFMDKGKLLMSAERKAIIEALKLTGSGSTLKIELALSKALLASLSKQSE